MAKELKAVLENNNNLILGKSGCPYCRNAALYLIERCIEFVYIPKEKNQGIDDEIRKIREGLAEESQRRHTYPAVFIDGKLVGGFTDLKKHQF